MERLGWQGTFKFQALWSVRDGKGLIVMVVVAAAAAEVVLTVVVN